ncbi:hypothetical protein D3C71_79520 [compost metagenome]
MAKFKDNPLQQVVDDLNIQNVATIPVPLKVENCELVNPIADATLGEFANTRGTLRVVTGADGYPVGEMQVTYRRLKIQTLAGGASQNVTFVGVPTQTKTLEEILQRFMPGSAAYVLPELQPMGPFDLTRTVTTVTLTPKPGSLVLAPEPLVLNVSTVNVDIGTFTQLEGLGIWLGIPAAPFPAFGADTTQDLLNRLMASNGHAEPLLKEDVIITSDPDYAHYTLNRVTLQVTNPDSYYSGTNTFTYYRNSVQNVLGSSNQEIYLTYDSAKDLRQNITDMFQSRNVAFDPADIEDTPIKPVRQVGFNANGITPWDYTEVLFVPGSLYMGGGASLLGGQTLRMVNNDLYPFEAIVSFNVATAGVKNLFTTTNGTTMPVTIELLEKPVAFAPTTLDVNTSFNTLQSLPVGSYKIRITRPDSYKTPLRFNNFSNSALVTRIFKVKGHDLTQMFYSCPSLVTIDAGSLDECTYAYKADSMFSACANLASLPNGLLNSLQRCFTFYGIFNQTSSLHVVPDDLFAFIRGYDVKVAGLFEQAGPTIVPANLFKDVHFIDLRAVFRVASNIQQVSGDLITNMNLKRRTGVTEMFDRCSSLQAIPANLFANLLPPKTLNYLIGYQGDWDFSSCFKGCSSLTTIPETLFTNLFESTGYRYACFSSTFNGCTSLTDIPQHLFRGAKAPGAQLFTSTFQGCTSLTTIRADLFHETLLRTDDPFWTDSWSFRTLMQTFEGSGLTTLPVGMFTNNTDITNLYYTFKGTKITEIPVGFLQGLTQVNELTGLFNVCSQLASLPDDLFDHTPLLAKASDMFYQCIALASLPVGLFDLATKLSITEGMFTNSGLTSLPAGLFANNAELTDVSSMFYNCKLAGVLDNIFTNQPLLTDASTVFAQNFITQVGANVFSGAPAITSLSSAIAYNQPLTVVHPDLLKYQTALQVASYLFAGCIGLTTVPGTVFAQCPEITEANWLFNNCTGLTSIPATLFANSKKIISLVGLASGCVQLPSIPAGLFAGLDKVERIYQAFTGCVTLAAVPNELFKDLVLCRDYSNCFQNCTALATIGTNLFGLSTAAVTLEEMFENTAITVVPDGIFFNLKNITSLSGVFCDNPQLVTVGRLVQNTVSTRIYVDAIISGFQRAPTVYPDLAVADNLIDSMIPVTLTTLNFGRPFDRRSLWTKDITNLFGANCKIVLASINKDWFRTTKVVGSGATFITKHQIAATSGTPALFTGVTTLNDYASLPAWSKA